MTHSSALFDMLPHHRMLATRNTCTWIPRCILSCGSLPSTEANMEMTQRHTRLRTVDERSLRPHYAETLRPWRERFVERRDILAISWTFAPTGSGR